MEEETTGQNRLFVILAISLIGLLVLGLVGIGGVFIIRQNLDKQAVASRPTPTLVTILPNATPTFTPAAARESASARRPATTDPPAASHTASISSGEKGISSRISSM